MDITEKDDKELVENCRAGDEGAFGELIRRHSSKMFGVAYGLLGKREDAEEVVQDAFVKSHSKIHLFRGDASFSSWLYRIVVNLSRNRYAWNRSRGEGQNISISEKRECINPGKEGEFDIPDNSLLPLERLLKMEFEKKLLETIKKLPDKLREIIVLRHIEEMSYEKIANLLDCELGTIKSRLARARLLLAGELLKENQNE